MNKVVFELSENKVLIDNEYFTSPYHINPSVFLQNL